jgi:hypothetical protein
MLIDKKTDAFTTKYSETVLTVGYQIKNSITKSFSTHKGNCFLSQIGRGRMHSAPPSRIYIILSRQTEMQMTRLTAAGVKDNRSD